MAALTAAGGIQAVSRALSPDELNDLVAEVAAKGDAARGEAVFRRAEQSCLKCHSIAGAGGRVGPDLVSIGASAQIDYLIESILVPSAKIKENYHSLTVVVDGRITSGVKVRETDKELVLRDAEDREVALSLDSIEEKIEGGSLMPVGLADTLTRGELVDLVRFLSELGKVGPYATSKARVVSPLAGVYSPRPRRHRRSVRPASELAAGGRIGRELDPCLQPSFGQFAAGFDSASQPRQCALRLVRFQIDVVTAGRDRSRRRRRRRENVVRRRAGVGRFANVTLDLAEGTHTISLLLGGKSTEDLRLELADVPGSPAQVQIVGGK